MRRLGYGVRARERAQASGGAVEGGCRRSRGWAGVSLSGEDGAVFQPVSTGLKAGAAAIEVSAAAAFWQAPMQWQVVGDSAGASCPPPASLV